LKFPCGHQSETLKKNLVAATTYYRKNAVQTHPPLLRAGGHPLQEGYMYYGETVLYFVLQIKQCPVKKSFFIFLCTNANPSDTELSKIDE